MSFIGKVSREYFNAILRIILPATGFLFIMQALFQPLEGQELFRIWFLASNNGKYVIWHSGMPLRIFVMVSSFTLFLLTTHPSELMSDLTRRGLPGQFAYVIISTLQIFAANASQGTDHHRRPTFTRTGYAEQFPQTGQCSLIPLVGPLVFGSLVEVEERAIAIEAAGSHPHRVKTSLHEIPDTNSDRSDSLDAASTLVIISLAPQIMAIVNLQNVTYKYPLTDSPALQNINLQVKEGEFVAVVGPNGAGKSTLCYTLAGFVPHFFKGELTGTVEVAGMESSKSTLDEWVLNVGLAFQNPFNQISGAKYTVFEELLLDWKTSACRATK